MELLAFLGKDRENWGQITGLIQNEDWEKILLLKTTDAKSFHSTKKSETLLVNSSENLTSLKEDILKKLKGKLSGLDVCLSIASGNGKEHMALISALLSLPIGIRLVVFTKKGVEFIN